MDDNTKNTIQNHINTKEVCLFMHKSIYQNEIFFKKIYPLKPHY
jgi:hypothetical protein